MSPVEHDGFGGLDGRSASTASSAGSTPWMSDSTATEATIVTRCPAQALLSRHPSRYGVT